MSLALSGEDNGLAGWEGMLSTPVEFDAVGSYTLRRPGRDSKCSHTSVLSLSSVGALTSAPDMRRVTALYHGWYGESGFARSSSAAAAPDELLFVDAPWVRLSAESVRAVVDFDVAIGWPNTLWELLEQDSEMRDDAEHDGRLWHYGAPSAAALNASMFFVHPSLVRIEGQIDALHFGLGMQEAVLDGSERFALMAHGLVQTQTFGKYTFHLTDLKWDCLVAEEASAASASALEGCQFTLNAFASWYVRRAAPTPRRSSTCA